MISFPSTTRGPAAALLAGAALAAAVLLGPGPARAGSFAAFESGHVRPLALSPDGTRLFAVNTPDNRLEVFSVIGGVPVHQASVGVGLEPVAVAARSNGEAWVVNHLSDSISIVDVASTPPRVVRTLLVGDEPRDLVFANGSAGQRAYVTTARRGQNSPVPPLLTTPGVGRALVWVFDPASLGDSLEGEPLQVLELFGDTPRALAVSPDGETVYAAVFHSGNRTTTVPEGAVCDGGSLAPACTVGGYLMPGGLPAPDTSFDGTPRPETGLVVRFDEPSGQWRDELGRNWNDAVRFDLPDYDVFAISNTTLATTRAYPGVGTILFNMVANPASGKVYVTNTEAANHVRFEGPGDFVTTHSSKPPGEPASVVGHLHEARITVLDAGGGVEPRHLNKHIDYSVVPSPPGVKERSLATPLEAVVSGDGSTLYVAAFGSQKVGVLATAALEGDTFVPSSADHIALAGGGPTGLVLDEARQRLYVATRFDNSVSAIDTASRTEVAHVPLYNPEPAVVTDGRAMLYDANLTSSNGEASCASCHVFGDLDSLAWDLGNPDGTLEINSLPVFDPALDTGFKDFHPMKGPMTTQTLRGMARHGAMHWRGDRSVGHYGSDPLDEMLSFRNFIVAFEGLLGNDGPVADADMDRFAAFMLEVVPPPNPIRPLDNQLVGAAFDGQVTFPNPRNDRGIFRCTDCHAMSMPGGVFGTAGFRSDTDQPQQFKTPHLRNLYAKVGMFGMAEVPLFVGGDHGYQGPQVRGFGMLHDGSVDTVGRFLGTGMFSALTGHERESLEQFLLQFPSNHAPIVGQQATLAGVAAPGVAARIDLMLARAGACYPTPDDEAGTECDLVVRGAVAGESRSWLGLHQGDCDGGQGVVFRSDRAWDPVLTDAQLRTLATAAAPLTYTCAPAGSGERIALDRDEDGALDRDELDAGSDPADAASLPAVVPPAVVMASASKLKIRDDRRDDESRRKASVASRDAAIALPAPGSATDPTCNGDPPSTVRARLAVASATSGQQHRAAMPCGNWELLGTTVDPKGYRYRDRELDDGTVRTARWSEGRFTASLAGSGAFFLGYDLVEGLPQDTVDVVLWSEGSRLCMACPPSPDADGSDGTGFSAKDCPAPAACGVE